MVTVAVSLLRRSITNANPPEQSLKSPLEAGFFFILRGMFAALAGWGSQAAGF